MSVRMAVLGGLALAGVGATGVVVSASQGANATPQVAHASGSPVAVELFTSQGCSSCPPADALLAKLSADPNVVAITRPVTYWDNLGWKDTLAREGNTQLQRAYAARGGVGAGVYTPQAMVQGQAAAVGSSEAALRRLIASAQARPSPTIEVGTTADGGRTVSISGTATPGATVTVLALRSSAMVRIGNGENGGRSVRYTNVVVGERQIGPWSGGHMRYTVPASAIRIAGADRAAVLVQQGKAGPILAARLL